MSENREVPSNVESVKPKVLYRGSREKIDLLDPQPILETEKYRFPKGIKSVVFASQYKQEALAYSVASRYGVGGFLIVPFWKDEEKQQIGWKLELSCKKTDLSEKDKTYLYEINPDGFSQNSMGEWYSSTEIYPIKRIELAVGEALKEFDEVKFAK